MEVVKAAGNKAKGGTAHAVLDIIGKLYRVEHNACDLKLDPAQIKELRQAESKPLLDKLKTLLDDRSLSTPPKSLHGKASN